MRSGPDSRALHGLHLVFSSHIPQTEISTVHSSHGSTSTRTQRKDRFDSRGPVPSPTNTWPTRWPFSPSTSSTSRPLSFVLLLPLLLPPLPTVMGASINGENISENGFLSDPHSKNHRFSSSSSSLLFLGTGCSSAVPNLRCLLQPSDPPCGVCFQSLSVPPDRNPNYRFRSQSMSVPLRVFMPCLIW